MSAGAKTEARAVASGLPAATGYDPREMARRGRIGALVTLSRHDARDLTAKARATFIASFEAKVDPDGILPPAERTRRAEMARRAHYARMAGASVRARSRGGAVRLVADNKMAVADVETATAYAEGTRDADSAA